MSDIADLKQRVDEATEHFGRVAEQDQTNHSRLADLLSAVEKNLARSQGEIERLNGELTRTREENEQLRAMLQNLVESVEARGSAGADNGLRALEERLGGLLSAHEPEGEDHQASPGAPADDPLAGGIGLLGADEPATPSLEAAFGEEPAPAEETPEPPQAAAAKAQSFPAPHDGETPRDEAKPEAEDGAQAREAATPMAGVPSDADLSAVNRIIQRVSLLTGEFRGKDKTDDDAGESEGEGGEPGSGERAARGT